MTTQPEALRLADALEAQATWVPSGPASVMRRSAAELRRLSAENKRFAALVCDYAAEEAPDAIRKIAVDRDRWHTKAQQAEAQRDALLEALKLIVEFVDAPTEGKRPDVFVMRISKARAAIKNAEGGQ